VYWLSLWLLLPPLSQHFDVFAAIAAEMRRQIHPLIEFSKPASHINLLEIA